MGRSSREEWAKRVQRWVESDLTAAEFGAEAGINPRTLTYWKWRLGQERVSGDRRPARGFVEVAAPVAIAALEVERRRRSRWSCATASGFGCRRGSTPAR